MERRPSREDLIGRHVGRYNVMSHLASGGMSELYVARQEAVGGFEKNLVIKILQDRYAQHPRVVRMFLDEARLSAKLNHPSIVHVYDVAEEEGSKYIAMEYIHGETLTDIIKRGVEVGNFLPLEHALHIASQVAAGLDYAHRRHEPTGALLRIVHRDVSPSNIMVSFEGQTKIIDFGIARVQDQIREESGMHPGKASYMSPEQVEGSAVDYRSDIFSLGIILFEITLAQRLWRGPAEEVKRRIVSEAIPPPTTIRRDYPPALELIVMRALEKRPEDRYQSAEEMRQDLEELLTTAGLHSGARRVSLYLRELFPLRAAESDDGIVQPRLSGEGDSVPLPTVGHAPPHPSGLEAPEVSGSSGSTGSTGSTGRSAVMATPFPPITAGGATPAAGPVSVPLDAAPRQSQPRMPALPAVVPAAHGPSNAKLALAAAVVTFALVTAVVLLGRSRRPEVATVTPPVEDQSPGAPVAGVQSPPSAARAREPNAWDRKPSASSSPPAPGPSSPTAPRASAPTPTTARGLVFTNDRSRYRRPRRQMSLGEPSSSGSSSGRPNQPTEVQAPPPAASPVPEVQHATPPAGESTAARPALRPAVAPVQAPTGPSAEPVAAPALPPGFIDAKAVTAVVRTHAAEVQACFDRALMEHADLHGRLVVRATIDPRGHVLAVTPTAVMEGGGRLQTCVVAAFERWTFPEPTGGVKGTVTYSFSFE